MKDLYQTPLKKLPLIDVEERLAGYKKVLSKELKSKKINFDFHLWVSTEWFCPDGVPGFALPFYLFNPKLKAIHKKELGFIEGRSDKEILKLMRHELGHAIDNAFALRKNKNRQFIFGSSKKDYPDFYTPKARSRNFVNYLGEQYAQSHPDEDFAETFAFWLDPSKKQSTIKLTGQALKKWQCMDQLMKSLQGQKPVLKNKFRVEDISKEFQTLSEYYADSRRSEKFYAQDRLDHRLKSLFQFSNESRKPIPLAQFLSENMSKNCQKISRSEGVFNYEARLGLKIIIKRAESLGIQASLTELRAKSPSLIQREFRYLKQKDQLKYYL